MIQLHLAVVSSIKLLWKENGKNYSNGNQFSLTYSITCRNPYLNGVLFVHWVWLNFKFWKGMYAIVQNTMRIWIFVDGLAKRIKFPALWPCSSFLYFFLSFVFPCKNTAVVYMLKKYHKNRIDLRLHHKVSSRSQSSCKLWHHSCHQDPVSLWKSVIVITCIHVSCYFISVIQVQMILWEFC